MTFEQQQALIARAQRARAAAVSNLIASAAQALAREALRLRRAVAAFRARTELRALSDRMLKDIGVSRSEIESLFR